MSQACPICRKPSQAATSPFCSPRCAEIDLGRWLTEQYVVPGADGEAHDPDHPPPDRPPLERPPLDRPPPDRPPLDRRRTLG